MIQLENVHKSYGQTKVLKGIDLQIQDEDDVVILGPSGSGKSTLLNVLSGLEKVDEGHILIQGQDLSQLTDAKLTAFRRENIAFIFQQYYLLPNLTVRQNVKMGANLANNHDFLQIIEDLGLGDKLDKYPSELSGGEQQRVSIARALAKKPEILFLDEPTGVVTPQETEKLFAVLRNMRKAGKSIIIITHKLNEVLELSDRVAVLRKGKYIDTVETAKATVESLTEMMVGEKVKLDINRTEPVGAEKRIEMRGITCRNKEGLKVLTEASFTAYSGEILGVAGISGSGQKELLESVAGLQPIESGEILYYSPEGSTEKISEMKAEDIKNLGITLSFVPEDRLGMGLVGSMDLTDNMMIRSYKEGRYFFADRKSPKKLAEDIVEKLDVVTPGVDTPVSRLSGGNVQKILVGREIASNPTVLMVAYPVRGLDINSSYTIYNLLNDQKKKGVAVICVGEDLDVLLELCDKILVLNSGKVAGIVDARTTTKEKLGLMMTGLTEDKNE